MLLITADASSLKSYDVAWGPGMSADVYQLGFLKGDARAYWS